MTGKKIKFALKLKEGVEARNLQELKEAFDLNQIIAYFLDGKLETWLLDRYYNDLAEKIGSLEKADSELRRKVCEIFEVEYEEDSLSVEEIEERNQRIRKLKEITDDETIIKHVDKVAFSQEELADLLDSGQETIYLCGTGFHIPVNKKGIRYIGIKTKLDITEEERENYEANDIELIDLFNDYSEETKDEYKKRIRFGEIFLDTDENQDSTQESKFQAELKAAKQRLDNDIILHTSEYSYLAMDVLGFDYAVYKVLIRDAEEKDKGNYRLNYSKLKRVLKVLEEYKRLSSAQGRFTDEEYANNMNFAKENLLVIMGDNEFEDPEIEIIIHEIVQYYINKSADDSTVADEEATEATTGDDTSDEDFMEAHNDDSANNVQVPAAGADDAIRFKIPEKFYKIAETIGLADEKLFETVNNERFFNFSYYKDSWGIVYDALKTGMMQVISENSLKRFENMLKGLFSDILKEYGYDENGNKIAGYAVSNNAPLAVHEPVASYGTNETSEDEEDVVEDDDGFDENETEEEEVRPGEKEIHVILNGKKITVPPRKKGLGGAYHLVGEIDDEAIKEEDRDNENVIKYYIKINGKVVRGREEWQKLSAVIKEGDVIEFAYKFVE